MQDKIFQPSFFRKLTKCLEKSLKNYYYFFIEIREYLKMISADLEFLLNLVPYNYLYSRKLSC